MAKRPVKKAKSAKVKTKPKAVKVKKKKPIALKKNKLSKPAKKTPVKTKRKIGVTKKVLKSKKVPNKISNKASKRVIPKVKSSITKPPKKTIVTKMIIKPAVTKVTKSNPVKPTVESKKSLLVSRPKPKYETPIIIPPHEEHDENYMNEVQKGHFRQILLNWKQQLLEEMERTVHHMQDDATILPDPNDRATQEEEFSLELRARDRELKLIKKIEEALERIDNSDYGFCEACGVEIGVKRLEARPTATLCIDCKTIDEIREKHFS